MNREQLDEIRKRAEAASPGPWEMYDANEGMNPPRPCWSVANDSYHNPLGEEDPPAVDITVSYGWREDAEFIAAARTDVPALLDEIDRLNAVAWKLRAVMIQQHEAGSHFLWIDDCQACVKARDECDGDFSCDQQKAWQKEYEEALSLPLAAATTAEGSAEGGTKDSSKEGS